jgi:hypothetical protein
LALLSASCLALSHRACTAFRALSLRSSGVIFSALALPPFKPPKRPNMTAAGFFLFVGFFDRGLLDMGEFYVSAHEKSIIKKRL